MRSIMSDDILSDGPNLKREDAEISSHSIVPSGRPLTRADVDEFLKKKREASAKKAEKKTKKEVVQ